MCTETRGTEKFSHRYIDNANKIVILECIQTHIPVTLHVIVSKKSEAVVFSSSLALLCPCC